MGVLSNNQPDVHKKTVLAAVVAIVHDEHVGMRKSRKATTSFHRKILNFQKLGMKAFQRGSPIGSKQWFECEIVQLNVGWQA